MLFVRVLVFLPREKGAVDGRLDAEKGWTDFEERLEQIILVRHGESEGNADWRKLAEIPDHRLKLTSRGRADAFEAGQKLREMVTTDDRVRFYVSPYQRTKETLEEILKSFRATKNGESSTSGPTSGGIGIEEAMTHTNLTAEPEEEKDTTTSRPPPTTNDVLYDVKEEPRLREQDWGNFQNFEQMELIKAERKNFGTFFYRIPHGESGADVYDRVSIFLDTLARTQQRSYPQHPTVLIVVCHGLLARLFVMRFMRTSVAEFESWKNLHNGEILVIERIPMEERADDKTFPAPENLGSYKLVVGPRKRDESPETVARDKADMKIARRMTLARRATVDNIAMRRASAVVVGVKVAMEVQDDAESGSESSSGSEDDE